MLLALCVGVASGFVYAHDPAPSQVRTILETGPAVDDGEIRGTLSQIGGDALEITTTDGIIRLPIVRALTVEELTPLDTPIPVGATVNVGGSHTDSGFVVSGIVLLDGARP
jgi:hypothetical protein